MGPDGVRTAPFHTTALGLALAGALMLPVHVAGKMPATMQYLPGSPGYRSAWQATIQAAEHANEPGRFTAFIGYEWTSNAGGNNLHRNVIYRDGGSKASQVEPYTTFAPLGSADPRDLWKWMAGYVVSRSSGSS